MIVVLLLYTLLYVSVLAYDNLHLVFVSTLYMNCVEHLYRKLLRYELNDCFSIIFSANVNGKFQ